MLESDLKARALPPILTGEDWLVRRRELVDLLAKAEYGILPPPPDRVDARVLMEVKQDWAGKALRRRVELSFNTPGGPFAFPVDFVLPYCEKPLPLIVYLSFFSYPNGETSPVEEIIDSGYALAIINYNDVTADREDNFSSGLAALYERRDGDLTQWGKLGMWAWAASRVLDYALTLDSVDPRRIACLGHSRLGKTALWCGAQDERFAAVMSNDSGCSGAAISRGKVGETIAHISHAFPYWFCGEYQCYVNKEQEMPFDQHQLIAAMAPRPVYVASAAQDEWADPKSEFLSCLAASQAYEALGLKGLVHTNRYLKPGEYLHEGSIGYHLRPGTHFLSRQDWQLALRFLDTHMVGK